MSSRYDITLIGAGIVGSSLAMHLAHLNPNKKIACLDLDLGGELSSSELNAGGVRATWGQPLNIQLCKTSIEYFERHATELGYRPCGYLWMSSPAQWNQLQKNTLIQREMGWEVDLLDPSDVTKRFPLINKTSDLAGAAFGVRDGLLNTNRLKEHFREKAKALGVDFIDRAWTRGWDPSGRTLKFDRYAARLTRDEKRELYSTGACTAESRLEKIETGTLVNCAGAWASSLANILGYSSPSKAIRRQISLFDVRGIDVSHYGMMIDPSGVYFHPEATYLLGGFATPAEPTGVNFEYDGDAFFQEYIWPALYERSTHLEQIKHLSGWAGLYEVSPDDSAIVGPSPIDGIFELHSFSGHGVMQAYSAGQALAERMTFGKYRAIDLDVLSGNRFVTGQLISESAII